MIEAGRQTAFLDFSAHPSLATVSTHPSLAALSAEARWAALLNQADALEPLPGQVIPQFVRCGKPTCRCSQGSRHGPYLYRVWREDQQVHKAYVKQEDAAKIRLQTHLYQLLAQEMQRLAQSKRTIVKRLNRQRAISRKRQETMTRAETTLLTEHRRLLALVHGETARMGAAFLTSEKIISSAQITVQNARVIIEYARELREAVAKRRRIIQQQEADRTGLPSS